MKYVNNFVSFLMISFGISLGVAANPYGDTEFYKIVRVSGEITLEEWNKMIESDPSLEQVPDRHGVNPFTSEKVVFSGVGKAYFLFMGNKIGNISLDDGVLFTTGVPKAKCNEIAEKFGAAVIADDRS